jgi:uncharacterized membrane protein
MDAKWVQLIFIFLVFYFYSLPSHAKKKDIGRIILPYLELAIMIFLWLDYWVFSNSIL